MKLHLTFESFVNEGRYTECDETDLYEAKETFERWPVPDWFMEIVRKIAPSKEDARVFLELYEKLSHLDLNKYMMKTEDVIHEIIEEIRDGETEGWVSEMTGWKLESAYKVVNLNIKDLDLNEIPTYYPEEVYEYEIESMGKDLDYHRIADAILSAEEEDYEMDGNGYRITGEYENEQDMHTIVMLGDETETDGVIQANLKINWVLVFDAPEGDTYWHEETCDVLKDYESMWAHHDKIKELVHTIHEEGTSDAAQALASF